MQIQDRGPKINPEFQNSCRRPGDQAGILEFLGGHPGFSGRKRAWYIYICYIYIYIYILHIYIYLHTHIYILYIVKKNNIYVYIHICTYTGAIGAQVAPIPISDHKAPSGCSSNIRISSSSWCSCARGDGSGTRSGEFSQRNHLGTKHMVNYRETKHSIMVSFGDIYID